jgi:hypothetical protein
MCRQGLPRQYLRDDRVRIAPQELPDIVECQKIRTTAATDRNEVGKPCFRQSIYSFLNDRPTFIKLRTTMTVALGQPLVSVGIASHYRLDY